MRTLTPTPLLNLMTCLYIGLSLLGAGWIADEYNELRGSLYGYVATPLAAAFIASLYLFPNYWRSRTGWYTICQAAMVLLFLWGHILVVNAVSGDRDIVYTTVFKTDHNDRTLPVAYKQGGLGMYYRARW